MKRHKDLQRDGQIRVADDEFCACEHVREAATDVVNEM
jgi:hypothetical protein